jgi:hypothetical protein
MGVPAGKPSSHQSDEGDERKGPGDPDHDLDDIGAASPESLNQRKERQHNDVVDDRRAQDDPGWRGSNQAKVMEHPGSHTHARGSERRRCEGGGTDVVPEGPENQQSSARRTSDAA